MTGVIVKLDSGAEILVDYDDLLTIKRSDSILPARIELMVPDSEAAILIDQLLDTRYRVLH
ncbi:MAG: hypothetical protein QGH44_00925 [Arenicellales bacterium]|jgi:hypothetical protein|nr:hypothetical protein [Arenicellales bacterium]MDP6290940.1 hypothetical protein [Arenicellales bacterium]MDP7523045.1 hypothetical protein [Arenicellales bacterium]|tara:strand:+ start:757 stop:939 length:183 start_codon:yes stop_codon:yes gene_type:complete